MRRFFLGFAAVALLGLAASDASACHKRRASKSACEPAPVCEPAPAPVCEPVCETPRKKCFGGFKMPKFKGFGCHKKQAECAPAPCGDVVVAHHATYAAPQGTWAAPQAAASGQWLPVPGK